MKRTAKTFFVLFISCILLTGCGEIEKDYDNASNPEKFVKENFESYYHKEIELINKEEIEEKNDSVTTVFEFQLKDDETFKFNACSYWEESSSIPTRHYQSVNNYENTYATKLIQSHFDNNPYTIVTIESNKIKYSDSCELNNNKIIIEVKDLNRLPELATNLNKIKERKEIYAISLKIKYQEENVSILISKESTEEKILEELDKLKKS